MPTPRLLASAVVSGLAILLLASAPHAAPAGFSRIEHDALRGGGQVVYVHDVLAGGSGKPWLAVGYLVDSDGNRTPSAWSSNDGATWSRSTMEATGSPENRDGPFNVARSGDVAVAVGNRFDDTLRPAAWWSTSPGTWSAVRSPADPLFSYGGIVEALDAGPDGFVAVGYEHNVNNTTVTVFRSVDGRSWQVDSTFSSPANEELLPLDITSTGTKLVVVGHADVGSSTDGRIWVKSGDAWQTVDPSPLGLSGSGFQQVSGVAWDPTLGFVAGGLATYQNDESPTIWFSANGETWERLAPLEGGIAGVHNVITVPGGLMASGSSNSGPRVWRSANGRDWSLVEMPAAQSSAGKIVSVGSDGSKIVYLVTGQTGSQMFHRDGTTWKRGDRGPAFPASKPYAAALYDVAVSKKRAVAIGNDGDGRPLIMFTPTGASWRQVSFPDKAARLIAITAHRGVFTIGGWRLVRNRARMALWTSRTGTKWRVVGGTRFDPVGSFEDVTVGSSGLLGLALEPGARGFLTSVWAPRRGVWRPVATLGPGIPRAICSGPHGVVAVSNAGENRSKVRAWTKPRKGSWSREADVVAARALAWSCADGPRGTVLVGSDQNNNAASWRRTRPGDRWAKKVVAVSAPLSGIFDVVRDGSGYLATGTSGGRGQSDLAIWRSPDGLRWARVGETDPVSLEPGYQAGEGIVKANGRIVVVGRHGAGNAGLWTGTP